MKSSNGSSSKRALEDGRITSSFGTFITVRNATRDTEVASRVEVAGSNAKRSKGLLGRKGLGPGEGMWITPCEAIHTFFMQFPIDLIYVDKTFRVKKVKSSVKAWRISACLSAHSVLELSPGTIRESGTQPGDVLEFCQPVISGNIDDRNF